MLAIDKVTKAYRPARLVLLGLVAGLALLLPLLAANGARKATAQSGQGLAPPPVQTVPPTLTRTRTPTITPGGPTFTPTETPTVTPTPAADCWNSWRVQATENIGGSDNILWDIEAVSSNDMWAVGSYSRDGVKQTLIERWTGNRWQVVESPNVGEGHNSLYAVHAVSASDVWAAGSFQATYGFVHPLTLHWNGEAWTQVQNPGTLGSLNSLSSVSSNDVWAVGTDSPIDEDLHGGRTLGAYNAMAMHWNGTMWSTLR